MCQVLREGEPAGQGAIQKDGEFTLLAFCYRALWGIRLMGFALEKRSQTNIFPAAGAQKARAWSINTSEVS